MRARSHAEHWALIAVRKWSWFTVAFHLLCYAAAAMVMVGFAVSFRRGLRTMHLYAILYAGVALSWPFEPYRFLVPWTPLLLYFLLLGVGAVAALARRRLCPSVRAGWVHVPAGVACVVLLALFAGDDSRILGSTETRYSFMRRGTDRSEWRQVEQWIRANTAEGDVIVATHTADLFLATGRQTYDAWPWTSFCGPDRLWWRFYLTPGASEIRRLDEQVRANWVPLCRQGGAAYYVQDAALPAAAAIGRIVREHPSWFERLHVTPGRRYTVYRLHLPAEPPGGAPVRSRRAGAGLRAFIFAPREHRLSPGPLRYLRAGPRKRSSFL